MPFAIPLPLKIWGKRVHFRYLKEYCAKLTKTTTIIFSVSICTFTTIIKNSVYLMMRSHIYITHNDDKSSPTHLHFATRKEYYIILVQVAPAIFRIAKTWYLLTFILMVKMVVVCDLFSRKYVSLRQKDNLWTQEIITKSSMILKQKTLLMSI